MRLYFHLVSDFAEIPDTDGLEVKATGDLRPQILKALEEIRKRSHTSWKRAEAGE